MKTVICNPPWLLQDRIGFRSNVRWPFTVPLSVFRQKGSASYHFPIYQAYLAALMLGEGLDVSVIDATLDLLDTRAFIKKLGDAHGDICVIETSTPSFPLDIQTMRAVKEELGMTIIAIGPHTSIYHKEVMTEHLFIDYIVRGEYEATVLELIKYIQENGDPAGVSGITYRTGGDIAVNEDRPYIQDLDSLPYPARDLYAWERYHEPNFIALPWITMITSRGCPFKCTFCLWPQVMYGHGFRARSPANVVSEMEYCVNRYRPGEIFFDDDTFTIGKGRVHQICSLISEKGMDIIWSCMGRVDTVDDEMLSSMYRAGCRKIKFGVETGSPRIMAAIKKNIDLSKVPRAFEAAKRCGLEVHGTFMIGLPGETPETVRETVSLAKILPNDSLQFSIATPFPGTEFYEDCRRNGLLVTEDWSNYDGTFGAVMSYPHLSKKVIESLYETAKRKCYPGRSLFTDIICDIKTKLKKIWRRSSR
ncbi:MAG: radical SAM protein [Candidatus Tritonobacter lacicola]|nr:radical SAM protein [Candidatus Tritonobacter lacicola]